MLYRVGRKHTDLIFAFLRKLSGKSCEIRTARNGQGGQGCISQKAYQNSRQNVAASCCCHTGTTAVNKQRLGSIGYNRARTLEKHADTVYYATDKAIQAQYISMFESEGVKVALLSHQLDTQFVSMCESVNTNIKFKRIDSDVSDIIKGEDAECEMDQSIVDLFKKVSKNESLDVKYESIKDASVPAFLTVSEESRRMEEMMRMYAGMGMNLGESFPVEYTLVLNSGSSLVKKLSAIRLEDENKAELIANDIYKLALISQRQLTADELKDFLADSFKLLEML